MRPIWRITADGQAISSVFDSRLSSLSISDRAGVQSDELDLTVDNQGGVLSAPRRGVVLRVALGFVETGLTEMGAYTVDFVEAEGPVRAIRVRAAAVDLRAGAKTPKTRGWEENTLGEIAATIAAEHALEARIGEDYGEIYYEHLSQTGESDLHFLSRLADDLGAIVKVADGKLVMAPRGLGQTVTGQTLPTLQLGASQFSNWSAADGDRPRHTACHAWWLDLNTGEKTKVTAGSGKPSFELRQPFHSEAAARRAAEAKLSSVNRTGRTLRARLAVADLRLRAEQPIELAGLDAIANGRWVTTSVSHDLDGALTTEFEAEELA